MWELDRAWVVEERRSLRRHRHLVRVRDDRARRGPGPRGRRGPGRGPAHAPSPRAPPGRDGRPPGPGRRARRPLRHPQRLGLRHLRPVRLRPGRPRAALRAGHRPRRVRGPAGPGPRPAGRRPRGGRPPGRAVRPLRPPTGPGRWGARPPGGTSSCTTRPSWRGIGDPFVAVHEDEAGDARRLRHLPQQRELGAGPRRRDRSRSASSRPPSAAVEADLWRFVCDIDLRTRVVAHPRPVDDPLPLAAAPAPAGLGDRDQRPAVGPAPGRRRLPGRAALRRRGLPRAGRHRRHPPRPGRHLPGHRRPRRRRGRAGRRRDPDLSLDVAALGSIILGGIDAGELAAAGRITEHTEGAAARADRFFRWRPAPFCTTTF